MKKEYVTPVVEIVKFEETDIEMNGSSNDVGIGDWWA